MSTPPDPVLQRLIDQVRAAQADATPLRIRGGGSKDFYGGPLRGTPLDLAGLRGITSYEPTEMVITARAGTPVVELEAALAQHQQCLAFEPPRLGPAGTLGGMVAAGLAGPARAAVGSVRDFVLGATMINGRGELLQFGGQVMKNVAGYDVSRVLAGSMGVLGVIAEVSLKVPPAAAARQTLALEVEQAAAIELLQTWAGAAVPVRASAWQAGVLTLRLEGAQAAVESSTARLAAGHGALVLEPESARRYWDALRDQQHPFFHPGTAACRPLWRLCVPPAHAPLNLAGETLIEWGGGQRWLYTDRPAAQVRDTARQAGGHATVYSGDDARTEVFAPLSAPLERIHKALKAAFDPSGIFNPGRLYPWL